MIFTCHINCLETKMLRQLKYLKINVHYSALIALFIFKISRTNLFKVFVGGITAISNVFLNGGDHLGDGTVLVAGHLPAVVVDHGGHCQKGVFSGFFRINQGLTK